MQAFVISQSREVHFFAILRIALKGVVYFPENVHITLIEEVSD